MRPAIGVNVAMAGNFDVSLTVNYMIDRNIHLLAVQEHLQWGKGLSPKEFLHIETVCNENGYRSANFK